MRRNDQTKLATAEHMICEAMRQVEALGSDTRLTRAMEALQTARDAVGDFIDKVPDKPEPEAEKKK